MIYALIIAILTLTNAGPQEVWLFYYHPAGKITIRNEHCTATDAWTSQCIIPAGVQALDLEIVAPCSLDPVPVLVSEDWKGRRRSVHWEYLRNTAPCVHRQILPLVWRDFDPAAKELPKDGR